MRILNLDNPILTAAFKLRGCETLSFGYNSACDYKIDHPVSARKIHEDLCGQGFVPDLVFYCDSGNLPYFIDLESLPCPTAFYSIDTYCNPWHFTFGHVFDMVFTAQKNHLEMMLSENLRSKWLPLFARYGHDVNQGKKRDIPVAFVGTLKPKNIPDRQSFLKAFARLQPIFTTSGAYVDVFNRAEIVLNNTAASEVNFRCFEAMACGAALLMEYSLHGLEDLFTPGEHILPCYPRLDAFQAAETARQALKNPEELADLARRGHDLVATKHLDIHRAEDILTSMEIAGKEGAQERRLEEQPLRRQYAKTAYGMIYDDLDASTYAKYKEYFFKLAI